MKHSKAAAAAVAIFGLTLSGAASAEMASGMALAATCAGCHGTNGVSEGPAAPTLAGMAEVYIVDKMENYKSGDNYGTIMGRIAKGYSTEEFEAMGKYFAAQKFVPADQEAGPMAAKGAKLHDKYCEKCHADGGTDPEDESGFLSGQWAPYLTYTLTDLMAGDHVMSKKMKKQLMKMHKKEGDAGLQALVDYYSGNK